MGESATERVQSKAPPGANGAAAATDSPDAGRLGAEAEASQGSAPDTDLVPPPRWLPFVRPLSLVVALLGLAGAVALALAQQAAAAEAPRGPWNPTTNGRAFVGIGLALVPALLALAVLLFRPERGTTGRLGATAAAWTVTLLAALAGVWTLIEVAVDLRPQVGVAVLSDADVDAFFASTLRDLPERQGPLPIEVPTGVLLQSVEFINANNVEVTGFIWQAYSPTVPDDLARGWLLPEAVEEAYQQNEAYRFTRPDGTEVIGWYVSATLRQAFDYQHYPFDRQDVWLRLWHRDFERGVVLVPDFASYDTTDPTALAGLDPQFVYGAWDPSFTVFSYDVARYQTSFGYDGTTARGEFPELYFNVGLKRDFWGPFFDHVTLTLAVSVLLWGVLLLTTNDPTRKDRFGGLNTAGVFASCTGLLFTTLLEHNQIRSVVSGQQVAYMEILPFLLNFAIGLVAFNSILLNLERPPRFITYKNNLLPDLVYWPALLGAVLVWTLLAFFR